MSSPKRVFAISRKEFFHIWHDPRSLVIIIVLPVLQLIMFGYAMNLEIQRVDVAVLDFDHSTQSRNLIEMLEGSKFFNVLPFDGAPSQIDSLFMDRSARAALIIAQDFSENYVTSGKGNVQIIIDAADPNAGTLIGNYFSVVIQEFNTRYSGKLPVPFEVRPQILYNPDMKSAYFFVPGLIAMILIMISAMLTSITITREKETGTMEQILVSPISPMEIIFGKVIPYIFLAFIDGMLILILGIALFNIPFTGSAPLLMLLSTLYIVTGLSLGMMISTAVRTQQVAMMLAIVITMLPTVMLSGFIFPIKSMPLPLQIISYIVPAKYYLIIVRGIMLKGNVIGQLLEQIVPLLIMTAGLLTVALRKFHLNLEN